MYEISRPTWPICKAVAFCYIAARNEATESEPEVHDALCDVAAHTLDPMIAEAVADLCHGLDVDPQAVQIIMDQRHPHPGEGDDERSRRLRAVDAAAVAMYRGALLRPYRRRVRSQREVRGRRDGRQGLRRCRVLRLCLGVRLHDGFGRRPVGHRVLLVRPLGRRPGPQPGASTRATGTGINLAELGAQANDSDLPSFHAAALRAAKRNRRPVVDHAPSEIDPKDVHGIPEMPRD